MDDLPPSSEPPVPTPPDGASPVEEPQIYAVHHRPGGWSLSRRGLLAGAAGLAANGCSPAPPLPPIPPVPRRPGVPMPGDPDGIPVSIPCNDRKAHSATITVLAGSPDGRYAASADDTGSIHLWGLRPPAAIHSLKDKVPGVRRLVFDAAVRRLAAAEERASTTIFNLRDGTSTKSTLPGDVPIRASVWVKLADLSDPTLLTWLDNGQLWLHAHSPSSNSIRAENLTQQANLPTDLVSIAVTFDERTLALARASGDIELRRLDEPQMGWTVAHSAGEIAALAFSRQGDLLAVGGHDGAVRLFDVAARTPLAILRQGHVPVEALAFDAQGQSLVVAHVDKTCRRWPVRRTLLSRDGELTLQGVRHAAWLPAGDLVFLEDDRVVHWKEGQPRESARVIARQAGLRQLSTGGPNGGWISLSQDGNLHRWKTEAVQTPQPRGTVSSDAATIAYDATSQTVFAGSPGEPIAMVANAEVGNPRLLGEPGDGALGLATAPGGDRIAAINAEGEFRTWRLPAGEREPDWPGVPESTTTIGFSGDGRYLAASSATQSVVWSCATRHIVSSWKRETVGISASAFDPEGHFLLLGELGGISVWDVRTGRRVCQLDAPSHITWLGTSLSGKSVAGITEHGALCLWKSEPVVTDKTWTWGNTGVQVASLSPGGDTLLVAAGQTAAVWNLTTDAGICLIDFNINLEDIKGYEYDDEFAGVRVTYKVTVEQETTVVVSKRTIAGRIARPKPPPPPAHTPTTYSRPTYSPSTYSPSSSYHYWRPN